MLGAFGTAAALLALTWVVPGLADLRPWNPGEPLPLTRTLLPRAAPRVMETSNGELVAVPPAPASPPPESEPPPTPGATVAGVLPGVDPATLPRREPGVPTTLVDAGDTGMAPFYAALRRAERGMGLARASHWGDSTIAADGISGTVRSRLQARFGDGGPGFLAVGMDPRWSSRPDVPVSREGSWDTRSILLGGAEGSRYGLGGVVTRAEADSSVSFLAPRNGGARSALHRAELWYQAGPGGGSWSLSADGRGAGAGSAAAETPVDRFHARDIPGGYTRLTLRNTGGPATFYGVVMESKGPGVTWDALGVVGVGSHSFNHFGRKHLAAQVARRKLDLVVLQLGGNELGSPTLTKGQGEGYATYFGNAFDRIRAGAPEAGCLIVTPLDQATRKGGQAITKPTLRVLVAQQRAFAAAHGCAFWDAQAAMGGDGAIARWASRKPPLAWTDLLHLSTEGQAIIGDLLADSILAGYDAWVKRGAAAAVDAKLAEEAAAAAARAAASPPPESKAGTTRSAGASGKKSSGSRPKTAKPADSRVRPDDPQETAPSAEGKAQEPKRATTKPPRRKRQESAP